MEPCSGAALGLSEMPEASIRLGFKAPVRAVRHKEKAMYPYRELDRRRRTLQGALLSFGAPLGWFSIRLFQGARAWAEFRTHLDLYAYFFFPTFFVFSYFGRHIGIHEDKLRRESVTDPLTGLRNVRYFHERVFEELALAKRNGHLLSLLILDLDHFKRVNDRYGHMTGDEVLKHVAGILKSQMRLQDLAARVGGEEFAILLPDTGSASARALAERIRDCLEKRPLIRRNAGALRVTVSIGVSSAFPKPKLALEALYEKADQALYLAKDGGRNRVEFLKV